MMQDTEVELKLKREALLEKNATLDTLETSRSAHTSADTLQLEPSEEEPQSEGISHGDIIDDIMLLNEEVEVLDEHVMVVRRQLKNLSEIVSHAQYEDIGEENEYDSAAQLAEKLSSKYQHFKSLEQNLRKVIAALEKFQKEHKLSSAPIHYMIQLPPPSDDEQGVEQGAWLHTLPDHITGKTNCEMRVELALLSELVKYTEELQQR